MHMFNCIDVLTVNWEKRSWQHGYASRWQSDSIDTSQTNIV